MYTVQCFADIFDKKSLADIFFPDWKKVTTAIEKNPDKEPHSIMFLQRWALFSISLHR